MSNIPPNNVPKFLKKGRRHTIKSNRFIGMHMEECLFNLLACKVPRQELIFLLSSTWVNGFKY